MAKKKRPVELNRQRYEQIKKMDHSTMEACIAGYYDQGYTAGQKAAEGILDMAAALETIGGIKGIGTMKLERIRDALLQAGAKDIGAAEEDG